MDFRGSNLHVTRATFPVYDSSYLPPATESAGSARHLLPRLALDKNWNRRNVRLEPDLFCGFRLQAEDSEGTENRISVPFSCTP
jgi:hypothetical protein